MGHADQHMQLAINQAELARGRTSPRPPVGAVVVNGASVVGVGYTQPPGGPHAEVVALAQAGERARGADLYVTLEPCCHYGTTPPCVQAIAAAQIARVYIGLRDPNPLVNGMGVEQLTQSGIEVIVGIGSALALPQLAPFFKFIRTGHPYVYAKWAMTVDGAVATTSGDAKWVSSSAALEWVHDLRDTVDAIVIGAGTARLDNPALTVRRKADSPARSARNHQPLRVVIGGWSPLPDSLTLWRVTNELSTLLVLPEGVDGSWTEPLRRSGVEVTHASTASGREVSLAAAFSLLAERNIMAILLEGGPTILGAAIRARVIDAVGIVIAPKILGGGKPAVIGEGAARMIEAQLLQDVAINRLGDDMLMTGVLQSAPFKSDADASGR